MSDNSKVVKFKKRKNINIGIIIFVIMFLYIAANVYMYFTKDKLSIYEVQEGSTEVDNRITSLILRDEKLIYTDKAGYISYYQNEGARVAKNTSIYSVDDSGQLINVVTNGDLPITLTDENYAEINNNIKDFRTFFSNDDFSYVYNFKEAAQSTVLDLLNSSMIENGQALEEETGTKYTYSMVPSQESGVITYYKDNFESVTPDTVTPEMFQKKTYKRTNLRTTEMISQNSPVYKIVTSDTWSLIVPLTKTQYKKLNEKEQISFTVLDDDTDMNAKLKLLQNGSDYYAQLTMDKHLSSYLNSRYLDVKLDFNSFHGLKIPLTSVVEKDFCLVPLDYFSLGGESGENGLIKENINKKSSEITYQFTPAEIYYQDDSYAYVDAELFPIGTSIQSATNSDKYQITKISKLPGVYNVNAGYAVFKRIEILYKNKEYCIVEKDTSNGLSAYDHIALDGKSAVEQKIIY